MKIIQSIIDEYKKTGSSITSIIKSQNQIKSIIKEANIAINNINIDMEQGVVHLNGEDHILEGETFGSKLKNLRSKLFHLFGIKETSDIINELAQTKKVANKINFNPDEYIWLKKSSYNKNMLFGKIMSVENFIDKSVLIEIKGNNKISYVFDIRTILKKEQRENL